jgi:uncharacterized protein (TIGR02271 family)
VKSVLRITPSHVIYSGTFIVKTTEHVRHEQSEVNLSGTPPRSPVAHEETIIPVLKEELDVGTRRVELDSGVRIAKQVEQREELIDEPLTKEEVAVERITLNRPVDGPVAVRYEGDTMIVPVLEEVLVVEKRLVLKEEIRITRRKTEFRAPERVTLRREIAAVERIEDPQSHVLPAGGDSSSGEAHSAESLLEEKRRHHEVLRRKLGSPSRD